MRRISLFLCCATAALCTAPAFAQSKDPPAANEPVNDKDSGPEIVVTALKQAKTLQEIPASVTVVGGEALETRNITSSLDLGSVAPGLIVQNSPGNQAAVTTRGLGTTAGTLSFDQSVGLFVDGVFAGRGRDFTSSLYDLESVQVVKGTQAAVLGKNTTLGAVVVTTRKPTFDGFHYSLLGSYDFELGSDILQAAVNLPLGDDLAVRVVGQVTRLEGWLYDRPLDETGPRNRTNDIRVTGRWRPSGAVDVTLGYQYSHYESDGAMFEPAADLQGRLAARAAQLGVPYDATVNNLTFATQIGGNNTEQSDRQNFHRATMNVDVDLGGGYDFTSLSGFSYNKGSQKLDFDFQPGTFYDLSPAESSEQYSQEFRLTSPSENRFSFLVGALLFRNIWEYNRVFRGYPAPGLTGLAAWTLTGAQDERYRQKTDDLSVFGQVTYRVADPFSVVLGGRYTREWKTADMARYNLTAGAITNPAGSTPAFPNTRLKRTEGNLDGSIALQFKASSWAQLYASWGKGTKAGGFNSNPRLPSSAPYAPEVAKTWEAGVKLAAGRAGYLNVSVFDTKIDGYQFSAFNGLEFVLYGLDVKARGVEAEGQWRPLDVLTLTGSVTYSDVSSPTLKGAALVPGSDGSLSRAPKWNGRFGALLTQPVTDNLNFILDGSMEFRSSMYLNPNPIWPRSPSYQKFDLRVGVGDTHAGWEVSLIGRNLTDERVGNYGTPIPGTAGAFAIATDPPRTITLQLTLKR